MTQFSKVPKVTVAAFDSAYRATMLPTVLDGLGRIEAQETRDVQAFNGGCRDYHSEQAIHAVYREKRSSAAGDARAYLEQIVKKVRKSADDAMAVDLARAAALAPAAGLALTDADVMALAREHRDDRTALLVLSKDDAKAARRLGAALARCDEAVGAWVEKIERFGLHAIARQNDAKDAAGFSEIVHRAAEKVQTAWDELALVIDGGKLGDPVTDALLGAGARRV